MGIAEDFSGVGRPTLTWAAARSASGDMVNRLCGTARARLGRPIDPPHRRFRAAFFLARSTFLAARSLRNLISRRYSSMQSAVSSSFRR